MKRSRPFRFLFLALLLLAPTSTVRGAAPAAPTDFPAFSIAFVGNSVVDLMWDPASGVDHYRLERSLGGHIDPVTPETIDGRFFYRDQQASGTDVEYRICAIFTSDETCSDWRMVHVGQVQGNLHKDLTWQGEVIELDGPVVVNDGVVLTVTDGADVSAMPAPSTIPVLTSWGTGTLQVIRESGAPPALRNISVTIADSEGLSVMAGAENQLVILDGVGVSVQTKVDLEYVSATNGTVFEFTSSAAGESVLSDSSLVGAQIRLVGGWVNIHHNSFQCGDCIRLRDGATATIEDNVFNIDYVTDGIDIGESDAAIRRNTFRPDGFTSDELAAGAVRVWPDAGSVDQVIISDNSFVADTHGTGVGVLLCGWDVAGDPPPEFLGPPQVTITGNSFRSLARGIGVCDLIGATVSGNSLSDNSQAVGVSADFAEGIVSVTGNCIAGNTYGLYGAVALPVSGNWWGSPLGPRNDTCSPVGAGDFVTGGTDDLAPLTQNNCSATVTNLTVHNIEAFQTVQTPGNTVPLVAGKLTAVRVYPSSSTGAVSGVGGELVVCRGETELGTVQPYQPVDTMYLAPQCTTYNEYQLHANRDRSLVFKLPAQWMTGTLTLAAEINPSQSIEEFTYTDNTGLVTVTIQPPPHPVHIGMVPINTGDLTGLDPAALVAAGELFRTLYPGSDVETTILPTMQWTQGLPEPSFALDSGMAGAMLLNTLGLSQIRLRAQGGWAGPAVDQLHGVIVTDVLQHALSEPTIVGGRGTAAYGSVDQVVTAAALSLNLGRTPSPNCSWEIGTWGYNPLTDQPVLPNTRNALCMPENFNDTSTYTAPFDPNDYWAGPTEYQELLSYGTTQMAMNVPLAEPQPYVLVSGLVGYDGSAQLSPAWQVTSTVAPLNPPAGTTYCLELLDGGGGVLVDHCFDLTSTDYWRRWEGFLVALPITSTPARIALRQGATELTAIPVSASPPTVAIAGAAVSRQAATAVLPISWSGHDGDGDTMVYSVLYSMDNGITWLPVASNLTETHYDLNLGEVPGGTQVWVRVEASDGFNTGLDTLGPFTVDDHDPQVSITQPAAGSTVSPTLTLLGYGYDQEEGELTGSSLAWSSDRDGLLGTGSMVFVQDLVTGTHTLTLVATDTLGHTGTASILIGVGEAPTEDTWFVYLPLVVRDL